ncbi:hypothetical protein FRC10_007995 [Ceratobasidium sp. 414]|nr:hypothetical protein FRC10_007995 [Ceratobasidium sp. 414]
MVAMDPATQSNYGEITTRHVHFDWAIDWKKRIISGSATHDLEANQDNVAQVVLDTSHLVIAGVQVAGNTVAYDLKKRHPVMGSALMIPLSPPVDKGAKIVVQISYSTTRECTAIGWLEKEQTAGKKFDYFFSQCQAIHARSLAPLQGQYTPSPMKRPQFYLRSLFGRHVFCKNSKSRPTYSADVTSLLPVLMSALRVSPPADGPAHDGKGVGTEAVRYQYKQPIPIPSYLIAIASGNVVHKPFAPITGKPWKTGVWTEPEQMDAAFWEFSEDTARYVLEAENILTPYEFGVYDLLVLPPSFPYGGMGWTTYTERLLQRALHGPAERDFSYIIGKKALDDALAEYENNPKFQRLVIDYSFGEDPDDAYSSIPYEKGSNFLLYLERKLGGLDAFLPYARDYVHTFRGRSIRTEEWKAHLFSYFEKHGGEEKLKVLNSVDWQAWLYGEGLELPEKIEYDTTLAEKAYALALKWDESRGTEASALPFSAKDLQDFNSNQTVVFLERLQGYQPLPASHVKHLAEAYSLDTTMNAEIRLRWYAVALSVQAPAPSEWATRAAEWVVGGGKGVDAGKGVKGRMKFCRPTFRAVNKVAPALAKSTFDAHSSEFHPIARRMIAKDIGADA